MGFKFVSDELRVKFIHFFFFFFFCEVYNLYCYYTNGN